MKKGGVGGAKTKTGLAFEEKFSLVENLILAGYEVSQSNVFHSSKPIGIVFSKHGLYSKFLKPNKIDYREVWSKKLLPDDAFVNLRTNTLYVIEKKYQERSGSVDEKLQTCRFKLQQYQKLVEPKGFKVNFSYVLNDWFKDPKYADTLNFVLAENCNYFFNAIPISYFGLEEKAQ